MVEEYVIRLGCFSDKAGTPGERDCEITGCVHHDIIAILNAEYFALESERAGWGQLAKQA